MAPPSLMLSVRERSGFSVIHAGGHRKASGRPF